MSDQSVRGTIFDIQHFSIMDGPGIRTNVFIKGCPLRCAWCHNPEGQSGDLQLSFVEKKCMYCSACQEVCPNGVHLLTQKGHEIDRTKCALCGACVKKCPTGALTIVGKKVTVQEVMDNVAQDIPFYRETGGMTLSGGEPFSQPEFALALLREARKRKITTCVETSGCISFKILEEALPLVDTFLYDFKQVNDAEHIRLVGMSNKHIIENLEKICERGANVVIRCPIIPGYNDTEEHFAAIAAISKRLHRPYEILPYHSLGCVKYGQLGLENPLTVQTPPAARKNEWSSVVEDFKTGKR